MESYLIYFAKVNGLLILFYLMYVLFLRKETFFTSNRWYLLTGLFISVTLPMLTFTKTIYIEPTPLPEFPTVNIANQNFEGIQTVQESSFDWSLMLLTIYGTISLLIILKIAIELVSFFNKIRNQKNQKTDNYTLVDSNSTENPFSFFNYIVINKNRFSENELHHILTHESIHVAQKHSLDVLLSKLFCALLWINPIIWLYRKAILQNLEFIADKLSFEQIENKYDYQRTLLKVVAHQHNLSITNQFYQSLIKKRIVMLNTNQSQKKNVLKYAFILPALVGFMLLFQVETVAQEKESKLKKVSSYAVSTGYSSIVTKNTSDKELKELEKSFSGENHKLIISKVKRNKNNEITAIKLVFDSGRTYVRVFERKATNPINDIKIYVDKDNKDEKTFGFEDVDAVAVEAIEAISVEGFESDKNQTYWSLDNMKKNGKDVVLIINGKIKGATEKVKMPFNEELGDMNEITPTEFEKKYKQKADKEKIYYEVETYKVETVTASYNDIVKNTEVKKTNEVEKKQDGWGMSFETSSSEDNISRIKEGKNVDAKKALLIFDGNEINYEQLDKINPNEIATTSISKNANPADLKKYGEKAKFGVINIESTKYAEKNNPIYKSMQNKKNSELDKKKEREIEAQKKSKLSKEEIEIRVEERKKIIEEKNKIKEEIRKGN